MNSPSDRKQLVVIGGGPGGYPAAFYAADLGMDVTLIDLDVNPGGVCLYRGCIPSKALLHVAKLINEAEEAEHWGVKFEQPVIDLNKLREWKDGVVDKLTGGLGQLSKARKVNYIQGRATFKNSNTLTIEKADGNSEELTFQNAIIATGSRPTRVPSLWIDSPNCVDSTGALELSEIPERMLVVGGGYIGLEMATVYQALGTKISVVEMLPALLAGADKDLVTHLSKRLKPKFEEIMLSTKMLGMEEKKDGIHVTMENAKGEQSTKVYDKVLFSIGRRPNSENLGLENTKVKVGDKGFIESDGQRRTAEPNIFAIGDIAGEPMLAHKATAEGKVAVEAISGKRTIFAPAAIPAVVFTDPEIAWAGITETEAKAQNKNVKVAKFPWAASGRATTLGRSDGVTKIIIDAEDETVLGIGICGPGAGELIAEATLAIEMGCNVEDLSLTIHPHPTLSETVMEAAEVYFGHSPHFFQPK